MCYSPVKVKERWRRIFECKAARRAAELPAVFLSFEVSMVGWPYRRVYKHCTECVQSVYKCTARPRLPTPGRNHLFRGDLATAVCCHCQHCARQMVTSPCALLSASSQHALGTRQGVAYVLPRTGGGTGYGTRYPAPGPRYADHQPPDRDRGHPREGRRWMLYRVHLCLQLNWMWETFNLICH